MPDEMTQEGATEESAENAFGKQCFVVIDSIIISDLSARFPTTENLCETFAPILKPTDVREQIKTTSH